MVPGKDLVRKAVEQEQGSLDSDCRMEAGGNEWQRRYACGDTNCNSSLLLCLRMQKRCAYLVKKTTRWMKVYLLVYIGIKTERQIILQSEKKRRLMAFT